MVQHPALEEVPTQVRAHQDASNPHPFQTYTCEIEVPHMVDLDLHTVKKAVVFAKKITLLGRVSILGKSRGKTNEGGTHTPPLLKGAQVDDRVASAWSYLVARPHDR